MKGFESTSLSPFATTVGPRTVRLFHKKGALQTCCLQGLSSLGYSKGMERAPLNGFHPVRPTELLPYGWKIYLRGIVKETAHQCEILGELIAFTPLQGNAQQ